ncbi:nucleotidyltransferase family protein [Neptunicella marina]|uniref:Nucleotidyltransferase family protein n=1 Tax=Neptunicella marina TaxID=2125989 RepID=A0A8J6ISE1_9ALTE|nr:nucleotidyltransferase family protein [Neptunicella marina]MBC3764718.1 nucleotidyltransferase family protein [Neptunicella marina]
MIHICTVILAAGQSQRFNGIKQLAKVNSTGKCLLQYCLEAYADMPDISLVLGANAEQIRQQCNISLPVIKNSNWQHGLSTSIVEGVNNLPEKCTHMLIGLADHISVSATHIQQLCDAAKQYPAHIIVSQYEGIEGVPAIFPRQFFKGLLALSGDNGAKKIIDQYPQQIRSVALQQGWLDIDTQTDLQNWLSSQKETRT